MLGKLLPADRRAEVLVFESEEGYFGYNEFTLGTRQEHTLGAFSPWYGQMALFEGTDVPETCRVLSHEGFHQALHAIAPEVPIWFNEGMAEYVGAARVEKGKVVERGGIQTGRLDNLTGAVKYGWQPLAFEEILCQSQAEFYASEAPLKYAQAWSMVRYFMDGDGGRWRPLMRDYIARVLAGDSERTAFEATFAKQDLRQLEAGWLKHYGLVLRPKSAAPRAGAPAPADVAPAAPPAPPTDLMPILVSAAPGPATGWSLSEGTLECSRFTSASLVINYEPPGEYDWRITARRTGGEGPLLLGLQGGGKTFVLRLDDRGATRIEGAEGTPARARPVLPVGKSVSLLCSVRKTGVNVTADRETVFEWKGDVGTLTYAPGEGMPEATRNLFLCAKDVGFQISAMVVVPVGATAGSTPARNAPPVVPVDPARSIPVDAELRRWIADEDGRQILALDADNTLELISLADRKVVRRISIGPGASCVFVPPGGFKTAWVGFHPGGSLVRVDLERGEVAETVPTTYGADALVVLRRIAYLAVPNGPIAAVDLAEKKDLGYLGNSGCAALAYEARKDRLWSLSVGGLTEFDLSKAGPALKELGRKNLSPKERTDLGSLVMNMGKVHPVGGQNPAQLGPRMMLDERSGRLYASAVAIRTDKPEATVGVFRAPAHSLDSSPAVREFASKILGRDQILTASADGKWAASGSHLFNAATFALVRELPLPTSLVAFSRDAKELYYYDWVNRAVVATDVESK